MNVALANGTEPAASILVGPGLAGLIVMIPSIPDSPPEGVCPVEAQTVMTITQNAVSKLRDLTAHYIRAGLQWPMIRNTSQNVNTAGT